jgi:hypothetical protein
MGAVVVGAFSYGLGLYLPHFLRGHFSNDDSDVAPAADAPGGGGEGEIH